MVKEIISLEGEKVIYEFYKRNYSLLHDDAKTRARKAQNNVLKALIFDKLDKLEPEVINQINDQNEQKKSAAVQYYIKFIRNLKTANVSGKYDLGPNDNTSAENSDAVGADVCETMENLNYNEEQPEVDSGTSKDDFVGKDASSQKVIKSDQKNDPE